MNKLCLLLLLSLITYVYLDSGCSSTENPKSADDCKGKLNMNIAVMSLIEKKVNKIDVLDLLKKNMIILENMSKLVKNILK